MPEEPVASAVSIARAEALRWSVSRTKFRLRDVEAAAADRLKISSDPAMSGLLRLADAGVWAFAGETVVVAATTAANGLFGIPFSDATTASTVAAGAVGAATSWHLSGNRNAKAARYRSHLEAFLSAGIELELALGTLREARTDAEHGRPGSAEKLSAQVDHTREAFTAYVAELQGLNDDDGAVRFLWSREENPVARELASVDLPALRAQANVVAAGDPVPGSLEDLSELAVTLRSELTHVALLLYDLKTDVDRAAYAGRHDLVRVWRSVTDAVDLCRTVDKGGRAIQAAADKAMKSDSTQALEHLRVASKANIRGSFTALEAEVKTMAAHIEMTLPEHFAGTHVEWLMHKHAGLQQEITRKMPNLAEIAAAVAEAVDTARDGIQQTAGS